MSTVVTSYKDLNLFFVENDAEFAYLGTLGYSGNINDRQFNYLRALGHTGALPDMRLSFWSGPSYVINGFNPDIVFNYTTNYFRKAGAQVAHDDLLLHTATGGGTVTDSDGVLKHRAHNEFIYSEQVDNAAWVKAGVTISADAITAPDGTATLDLITETVSVASKHRILSATTVVSGATYTQGCFAKTDGRDLIIVFSSTGFGATAKVAFDLTLGTKAVITGSVIDSGITDVGDGIFWCWATKAATSTVSSTGFFTLYNGVTEDYIGDGVSGLYLWGMHRYRSDLGGMQDNPDNQTTGLEQYVPTTTAAVYKRRNNYTFAGTYSGDGTELVTNGTFDADTTGWTANANATLSVVSGSVRIAADANGSARAKQSFTTVAGRTYQISVDGVVDASTDGPKVWVGTIAEQNNLLDSGIIAVSSYSNTFTATTTTTHLTLLHGGSALAGEYVEFDNVTVQERIPVMVGPKCLVEPAAATNLFVQSQCGSVAGLNSSGANLDTVSWLGGSVTTAFGYDSGVSSYAYTASVGTAADYTVSCIAKCGDGLAPEFGNSTPSNSLNDFALLVGGSAGDPTTYNVEHIGDGVYLVWGVITVVSAGNAGVLKYSTNIADTVQISNIQVELGSVPSSLIPTSGATATRALETLVIPAANLASVANTSAMSIHLKGLMSYADTNRGGSGAGGFGEVMFYSLKVNANDYIEAFLGTDTGSGRVDFAQETGGARDTVVLTTYTPDINVAYSVAGRHTSGAINGAVDGTALTANTTPVALSDVSSVDFEIGSDGGGSGIHNIQQGSLWAVDIADAGIEEAST